MKKLRYIFPRKEEISLNVDYFGTFDIETYTEEVSSRFIPYCAAAFYKGHRFTAYCDEFYKTTINRKSTIITDVILILLYRIQAYMKENGIKSIILYAHNLSSFDGYFILKACAAHNLKVKILKRGSQIFYIQVKIRGFQLEFRCSLLLLREDLNSCARSFNVPMSKLPFYHDWVDKSKLFYSGITPFSNNTPIDFKDFALKYCLNDCIMLYKILQVFDHKIREFGISLESHSYSIPSLAFKAFKRNYLEFGRLVNLTFYKSVDDFIREAYYGGRCEVFMAYIGNNEGYYYDVKGMYAQAMKQDLPCGSYSWVTDFSAGWLRDDMPKGFYKVLVEAPNMHFPILPYRSKEGKLIFPCGRWVATYYSEELLFAQSYGYLFKPIEALVFSDSKAFLKDYVEDFTKVKEMGGAYRSIGKLFINSLYGRFGLKRSDETTVIISREDEQYYSDRFNILDRVEVGSNLLLTYSSKPILEYYKENGIFSLYKGDSKRYKRSFKYGESNAAVAAAITALARIHLYKDIISVVEHGGEIAYCDTDSIFARFKECPLGQWHGNVYWEPDNPLTRFEEGVFLAPKMYSIKNLHTHIKGVKLDFVSHEKLLLCFKSKAAYLKVDTITQFYKENYDVVLRGIDKEFVLWDDDKRVWYQEDNNCYTKPKIIDPNVTEDSSVYVNLDTPPLEADYKEFSKLNILNPNEAFYQLLEGEVEIKHHKSDVQISMQSDSNKWKLLYFSIMAKLSLKIKPIFMKIIFITSENNVYTLTRFIYNPHIRFMPTLNTFIDMMINIINDAKEKYDIKLPGKLTFVIVFPIEMEEEIRQYAITWPIPEEFHLYETLRGAEEKALLKNQLELKLSQLNREIWKSSQEIKVDKERLSKTNRLIGQLLLAISESKIIDKLILSTEERLLIKTSVVKSVIKARIEGKQPSLQNVLGLFITYLKKAFLEKEVYILFLKSAILLIRELADKKLITITKSGKYSPYIINLFETEHKEQLTEEYYNNKIFFDIENYTADNSQIMRELAYVEQTPMSLNHEYFLEVKRIFYEVKEGRVPRHKYGFSHDDKSFMGEMLNLEEAFSHYAYICNQMRVRNKNCFYMRWYLDSRGRMYPSLTNFSIQSNRIIRAGFLLGKTAKNTLTKEEAFEFTEYTEYIINLVDKHVHPIKSNNRENDFLQAIKILKSFEIQGSKDHYELLMRKIELNALFKYGKTQIAPVALDGKCNVFQHISALTKDEKIAPLVNTTQASDKIDIYNWFKDILIIELGKKSDEDLCKKLYRDFKNKKVNMRGLVKIPIMTFPYGSTQYNIQQHLHGYLKNEYGEVEWDLITQLAAIIQKLRKRHLKTVNQLQLLLKDIISNCSIISWQLPDGFIVKQSYFIKEDITITTSFNKREMFTRMQFYTRKINSREHSQGITANFIHSWDAYHLRRIIQELNKENIAIFPIHDCILVDMQHIRVVKRIVSEEFNKIYSNPEGILKSFYNHIVELNPNKERNEAEINRKIKQIMGKAIIQSNKDLFMI